MSVTTAGSAATATLDVEGMAGAGNAIPWRHDAVSLVSPDGPVHAPCVSYRPADVRHWLDWQCRMISNVYLGAVFVRSKGGSGGLIRAGSWPDERAVPPSLGIAAAKAITAGSCVVQKEIAGEGDAAETCDYAAYPLLQDDQVVGAVVMVLAIRSDGQRQAVLQLLRWGMNWLEHALTSGAEERRDAAALALDAVSLVSRDAPPAVAGHLLCNYLADRFACSRVAFGRAVGLQVRALSLSHQVRFDRRMAQVGQLERAMEECVDQGRNIVLPAKSTVERGLTQAHEQLALDNAQGSVCSVPLLADDRSIGVLTLIRDDQAGFDETTLAQLAAIAEHIAPILELKQREARGAWRKLLHTLGGVTGRLIGAGYMRLKILVVTGLLAVAALTWVQTDQRVTATSAVEGALQQAVVAPFDGYVTRADARAGDQVEEGQLLATLDDRELLLEREKWTSERAKHSKDYQQALAVRDRAKVSMVSARIAQAEAQLRLVDEQLQRTRLRAPFAGVLVSGDLSRSLGAPVERGQLLFEIVPIDDYHVSLEVDEHDVATLATGQQGSLRLTGLPEQSIPVRISRILPVASADEGSNHFRVEAEMQNTPGGLRPGMQGVAKIVVGRGSLIDVWTHSLLDRLRLLVWSLGF